MLSTAIIIFACSATEGSRHTRLAHRPAENLELFEQLNKRIRATVKRTGLPWFIFDECNQFGHFYGQRIAHALQTVFNKGYTRAIIVGNNCPHLALEHLDDAVLLLQRHSMVIGPDQQGGAYLLGIEKAVFDARSFSSLHWESNLLFHDLKCYNASRALLPRLKVLTGLHALGRLVVAVAVNDFIRSLMRFHSRPACIKLFK